MVYAGSKSTGVPLYPRRRHSSRVSLKYPRLSNVEGGDRLALEENGLHRRKDTLFMSLLPKTNLASLSLAILAGLGLAAAHPANAQVLYSQPSNSSSAIISQVVPDATEFSSYCFDDFAVPGTGWDISQVTAFGSEKGTPGQNTAVSLAFTTTPDASAIATTYTGFEDANHNLVFTQPIHLDAGNYFITAFVTRKFGGYGGYWNFKETMPVHGQSFYLSNPGGRFGGGTPFHPNPGNDLAFEIDGKQNGDVPPAVPEPSSVLTFAVAALGIGGLMIAAKRKKAAPPLSSPLSSSLWSPRHSKTRRHSKAKRHGRKHSLVPSRCLWAASSSSSVRLCSHPLHPPVAGSLLFLLARPPHLGQDDPRHRHLGCGDAALAWFYELGET